MKRLIWVALDLTLITLLALTITGNNNQIIDNFMFFIQIFIHFLFVLIILFSVGVGIAKREKPEEYEKMKKFKEGSKINKFYNIFTDLLVFVGLISIGYTFTALVWLLTNILTIKIKNELKENK